MQLLPGMMVYLAYKAAASVQAKVYRDKKDLQLILKKGYFISKKTQERIMTSEVYVNKCIFYGWLFEFFEPVIADFFVWGQWTTYYSNQHLCVHFKALIVTGVPMPLKVISIRFLMHRSMPFGTFITFGLLIFKCTFYYLWFTSIWFFKR